MKMTEPIIIGTNKEGKKIFIKRPCKEFAAIDSYQKAFAAEARQGKEWAHPNLLQYIGLEKDEQGTFIALEYIYSVPLNRALLDALLCINTPKDSKQIMNQLMDAVTYLHSRNICHLDIRPENIFITRSAHDVRLANPANTYIACTPSFFIYKERYTAPELFKENSIPSPACDIYSLGKVMEYLYCYSYLSVGIRRIIRKATHPNPAKRYASVEAMQKAFNRARYIDGCVTVAKGVAAIAILALFYIGLQDEPVSTETMQFVEETEERSHKEPELSSTEADFSYSLPVSSDIRRPHPTDTLNFDADEHRRLAEQIFRKEFRKRAEKVVTAMYTPQMMNAGESTFHQQSMDGFSQLDKIQKELAEQFNMDPILTTRLSSEVISELTTESMKKLKQTEDED